ncbi:hypothetical protein, partial [Vibrio cholerae]|uniref:hypothetical protein n=1 Tax=Vibrio cholerae TaxID=666 RepID=UPI0011251983
EEVVNLQATSAHEKGLEITLKIDPKIPRGVVGDPLRIQQVLTMAHNHVVPWVAIPWLDYCAKLVTTAM